MKIRCMDCEGEGIILSEDRIEQKTMCETCEGDGFLESSSLKASAMMRRYMQRREETGEEDT